MANATTSHRRRYGRSAAFAAAGIGLGFASATSSAQEYCIVCSAPDAMYRCAYDNFKPGVVKNLGGYCAQTMQEIGKHEGCQVGAGITVLDCKGRLMRIDLAGQDGPKVIDAAKAKQEAREEAAKTGEPRTIADMVKRMQAAPPKPSPEAPVPAQQMSNPLADTWRCLTSLFTKCGD